MTTRLDGKRIVVTRASDRAEELCSLLEEAGAVAVRCPTIRAGPPESYEELDAALSRLGTYGWLVLTSANGVRSVFDRLGRLDVPHSALDDVRVAAVGPATAAALAEHGIEPGFVPPEARSRALGEALTPVAGESILLARADIADPALAEILRRRGAAHVDDVAAYRTVAEAPTGIALEELRRGVDGITFTSPSTVRGFTLLGPEWPQLVAGAVVATIGPVTSSAAEEVGLHVRAEAEEPTMSGLVEAVRRAFSPSIEKLETERRT